MKTILFRGKRTDTGEWVEGDLFHNDNSYFPMILIGQVVMSRDKHTGELSLDGFSLYEVDPETVSQYTGMRDKDDRKIFEGDCVGDMRNVVEFRNGLLSITGRPLKWHHKEYRVVGNIWDGEEAMELRGIPEFRYAPGKGQKWKHFKGNIVTIECVAQNTEDLSESFVIYTHEGKTWARPMRMFMSKVDRKKYPDADQEYRFEMME